MRGYEEEESTGTLATIWTKTTGNEDPTREVVVCVSYSGPISAEEAARICQVLDETARASYESESEKEQLRKEEDVRFVYPVTVLSYWYSCNQSAKSWRPLQLESTYG